MGRKPKVAFENVKYPGVRERGGLFRFRYSVVNPETGKRKQKETPGYSTALEAFEAGLQIKNQLSDNTFVDERNVTFNQYIEEYLKYYKAHNNVKESTVFLRKVNLNKASKYFGSMKLKEITKRRYQSMLDDLKEKGLGYNTINLVHISTKMLFSAAVELGIIKDNPASNAKMPAFVQTVEQLESGSSVPRYLEKAELNKFLDTIKEHGSRQEYAFFLLLAYTGLRIGEACALRWSDIKRKEGYISITKTLYVRDVVENYMLNTPKTKSSIREVDISGKVLSVLDNLSIWQKELMMTKRKKYVNGNFVFVNETHKPGYPMIHEMPQRAMKRYLEMSNLPTSLTPHSLRHTHASLLAEAGEDLEVIQRRLGHKNDQITRDIYLHVTKKRRKDAPLRFEKYMDSL